MTAIALGARGRAERLPLRCSRLSRAASPQRSPGSRPSHAEEAAAHWSQAVNSDDIKAIRQSSECPGDLVAGDAVADRACAALRRGVRGEARDCARRRHRNAHDRQRRLSVRVPAGEERRALALRHRSGQEELLARRIGENELDAIKVLQAIVDAQRDYASEDRDGDGVLGVRAEVHEQPRQARRAVLADESRRAAEPARCRSSSQAAGEGYKASKRPDAYHGYYYRMLKGQGRRADMARVRLRRARSRHRRLRRRRVSGEVRQLGHHEVHRQPGRQGPANRSWTEHGGQRGLHPALQPGQHLDTGGAKMKRIDRQRGEPAARQRATQPKRKGAGKKPRDRPDDAGARPPNGVALSNKGYAKQLKRLHVELVRLQEWVRHKGLKVCIVFEGRDGAGKGGTIKAITERVSPRISASSRCRADRAREDADVHAALHSASAGGRRGRDLRPQLVQPRRRRARDGLLHGGAG